MIFNPESFKRVLDCNIGINSSLKEYFEVELKEYALKIDPTYYEDKSSNLIFKTLVGYDYVTGKVNDAELYYMNAREVLERFAIFFTNGTVTYCDDEGELSGFEVSNAKVHLLEPVTTFKRVSAE